MANILNRTSFLEESAGLFTDERIAAARIKIIEWLDNAALGHTSEKCGALAKIQEVLISNQIELLEEFIDNILCFSIDPSQEVRRSVVAFIEQICKVKIQFIPRLVDTLSKLLRDASAQVIKRVIQACASIYRNTLQWICSSIEISDEVENAWTSLCLIKGEILDMIDNDNDGIRTNAVKFLEGVVILQTYADEDSMKRDKDFSLDDVPITLKIVKRRKLEIEALNIFDCLLKFHAASHISSVNLIACTGTLCTIAKLRTSFMNPVVDAIKNLNYNLPPTLTDSQVNSVRKHLKMQLINLLKNRGSFDMQSTIIALLQDLGSSQQEITRAIPKMDKSGQQTRAKRALNTSTSFPSKRSKLEQTVNMISEPSEDFEEPDKSTLQTSKMDIKKICEQLKDLNTVVQIVMTSICKLPDDIPNQFLTNYTPITNMSIPQQIAKISSYLTEQISDNKFSDDSFTINTDLLITRPISNESGKLVLSDGRYNLFGEVSEITESYILEGKECETLEGALSRKEEATKKLRETMEKSKGEHALVQRMKQRVKTLKLQEITKPLSKQTKEKYMLDAVVRILKAEQQSVIGGVSVRRRKILTVMAATFPDNIREIVLDFIMMDVKSRIGLAFSWLFEEYCLLQGFTRHSYIKTEHKPDYAYNKLIIQLIEGIAAKAEYKEKVILLRRIFLEAPILPDDSVSYLVNMCDMEDMSFHSFELIRDLAIRRPPRRQRFLNILLQYVVHENVSIREKSLANVISLYVVHKILKNRIDEFALKWLQFLEAEKPPSSMFDAAYSRAEVISVWNDELTKTCLTLALALIPYHSELIHKIGEVYTNTSSDIKRTILRAIEAPIRKMGSDDKELLLFIEKCPKGVETLITRIVHTLTEKITPTPALVTRIRELYKGKVTDVRILIPILSGLTKNEIQAVLPKFLKLNPIVVKEVFNRLLRIGPEFSYQNIKITPSEIFLALHLIDPGVCELKFAVKATSLCLAEKDVFTQDVLASCLQQLVEVNPIPILLMRTVIQSLTLYPRLIPFIINILQRLILKQVWRQKVIWDGFLKCCQRLKPHSYPVLMQLPPLQLQDVLRQYPDLRQPLLEYAETANQNKLMHIPSQIMDMLSIDSQDVFIIDDSGGYIRPENIKKEKEDFPELTHGSSGQPLPPGEE